MTHVNPLAVRAITGALLLITPVSAQLLWPATGDTVSGHLLFAASQVAGWALLAFVCLGIASLHPEVRRIRGGPTGRWLVLGGCLLQVLFGLAYGGSTAVRGDPLEASFVLFLGGFLAQFFGGLMWGRALVREPHLRLAGIGLLAMAVLGFLAIAVGDSPIHDISLLGSYAAWIVIGLGATDSRDVIRTGRKDHQNV